MENPPTDSFHPNKDSLILGFSGAPASKKDLWPLAAKLKQDGYNFIYNESVSTPDAFEGEKGKRERFARIAEEVLVEMSKNDSDRLLIIGHSLGGAEAVLFLDQISEDERFSGKQVDLVVFSPIGYGKDGFKGVWGWVEGTKRMMKKKELFEAHIAYPLPQEVAEKISPFLSTENGLEELVIKDQFRTNRRDIFERTVVNEIGEFDAHSVVMKINLIDLELSRQVAEGKPVDKKLLKKRERLIAPFFKPLLQGSYLDVESKRLLSDLHKSEQSKGKLLKYLNPVFISSLGSHAKRIFQITYDGFSKVVVNVQQKLDKNNISLNTHLVYMQNDRFIKRDQVNNVLRDRIMEIANIWVLADATHFTIGYDTDTLMNVVNTVTNKKTR